MQPRRTGEMTTSQNPRGETKHVEIRSLHWSPGERAIARKAFNLALTQELEGVISEAKRRAAKMTDPSDLWDLEHYLYECRKGIDQKYDYRYSVPPIVFGALIREGRLTEQDLYGLGEDKLRFIRAYVEL